MKWYFQALRRYAVFGGRARRREFWMFELWNGLIFAALVAFTAETGQPGPLHGLLLLALTFLMLYWLGTAIPALAGFVRRLHDTDHSGWWFFINVVPVVGPLVLFIFTIKDSDPGPNRFGPNPKTELANIPDPAMGYLAPPLPSSQEEGIMRSGLIDATGKRVLFWIFIIIILPLSVVLWRMVSPIGQTARVEEPGYEEFKGQVDRGNVREVTLYPSSSSYVIEGEWREPARKFRLTLPNKQAAPDLVEEMRDKDVLINEKDK